jgi:serine/threonine-protein kinase
LVAEPRRNNSDHELPRRVGGYDAFLQIGAGGMARVYLAAQRTPAGQHQVVVVKVLRHDAIEDEHVLALFMDEARIAMRLSHPNVIRTRDVVADPPDYLLAMDFQNGQSLLHVLRRLGRQAVPLDEHVYVLGKVLAGLRYAHELTDEAGRPFGIVHRDVSPSNVLVCYTGEIKLLDFGIAKATGALAATQDGVVKGKLGYAAPEQCLGKPADPRSDVYAVGVMLWEAIAGRRRASGETWHSVLQARLDDSEPELEKVRPDAPPALLRAARKALAHDPEQRYQTAKEFQKDLEDYLGSQKAHVGPARISAMLKPHFEQDRIDQQYAIEAYLTQLRSSASGQRRRVPLPPPMPTAPSAQVEQGEEEDTSRIPVDAALLRKTRRGSMMPPAASEPSNPPVAPSSAPPRAHVTASPPPPEAAAPPSVPMPRSVAPAMPVVPPPPGVMRRSLTPPPSNPGAPSSGRASAPSLVGQLESASRASRPSTSGLYPVVGEAIVVAEPAIAPPEKGGGGRSLVFAVVGLAALAGAGVLVLQKRAEEAKATTPAVHAAAQPTPTSAPTAATSTGEVQVRIAVEPSNAELRLDGRLLTGNPFVSVVPREATIHELSASADGYKEEKQVVQFMRDIDLTITLHRGKAVVRVAPSHAPIAPAAAAAAMKPAAEARPAAPATIEPGMELGGRPENRSKHDIDEKDPYSQ